MPAALACIELHFCFVVLARENAAYMLSNIGDLTADYEFSAADVRLGSGLGILGWGAGYGSRWRQPKKPLGQSWERANSV